MQSPRGIVTFNSRRVNVHSCLGHCCLIIISGFRAMDLYFLTRLGIMMIILGESLSATTWGYVWGFILQYVLIPLVVLPQ